MAHKALPLFMFGQLNAENTKEIVSFIVNINNITEEKSSRIELYINSEGGSVYYAMAIINCMKESEIPVHTICLGNASSSAAHIFVQGHKGGRIMKPNSTLMFHSSLLEYDVCSLQVLEAEWSHNMFIEDWFNQQLLDNCNLLEVEREFGSPIPRYVSVKEAIEFGMCDNEEIKQ